MLGFSPIAGTPAAALPVAATASPNATVNIIGVPGTGSVGMVSAAGTAGAVNANITITGTSAAAAAASISTSGSASIASPSVSSVGASGTVTTIGSANTTTTGVSGSGSVGTLSASGSSVVNGNATITGVSTAATSSAVTSTGSANRSITGVSGSGSVGTTTTSGFANTSIVTVSGTGSVGTTTTSGFANTSIVTVSGTGSVGTLSAKADVATSVTGVPSSALVGTVTTTGSANRSITGVSGSALVGTTTTFGFANTSIVTVSGTGSVGTLSASGSTVVNSNATITGVPGSALVGTTTTSGSANRSITGILGTGSVGVITAKADVTTSVIGVLGAAAAGLSVAQGTANTTITGVPGTGSVGTLSASGSTVVNGNATITGVSGSAVSGTVIAGLSATVAITNAYASGQVAVFDRDREQVSLLLHFDTISTPLVITDSSLRPKVITGAVALHDYVTSTPTYIGAGSFYNDGNGVLLTPPTSDFDFADKPFTIEAWVNYIGSDVLVNQDIFALYDRIGYRPVTLGIDAWNQTLSFSARGQNGSTWSGSVAFPYAAAFSHIALVRLGNTFTVYVNGVSAITSSTGSGDLLAGVQTVSIASGLFGYIDEVRVTKSVARYTSNFTPSTAPFDVSGYVTGTPSVYLPAVSGAGQVGVLVPRVDTTKAITGVSATAGTERLDYTSTDPYWGNVLYQLPFDGSAIDLKGTIATLNLAGGSLTAPGNFGDLAASFGGGFVAISRGFNTIPANMGSSDFTIEFWFKPTAAAGVLFSITDTNLFGTLLRVEINAGNAVLVMPDNGLGASVLESSIGTVTLGQWHHVAVSRSVGQTAPRLYINGVRATSNSNTGTFDFFTFVNDATIFVGAQDVGVANFSGSINDLRITAGVARYPVTCTPPGKLQYSALTTGTANNLITTASATALATAVLATGNSPNATVNLASVASTAAVGSVTTRVDASITISGVAGSGSANSVVVRVDSTTAILGVAASGQSGSPTNTTTANIAIAGTAAASIVGIILSSADARVTISGVSGTITIGTTTESASASTSISGTSSTANTGITTYSAEAAKFIDGVFGTSAIGLAKAKGTVAGASVYPDPAQVAFGVVYGPTGVEFTGTYKEKIRYELETGRLSKPVGTSLAFLL